MFFREFEGRVFFNFLWDLDYFYDGKFFDLGDLKVKSGSLYFLKI